jgi:hypothetical protein
MDKRIELDVLGAVAGSDKSSVVGLSHDYLRHYEFMFSDFRDRTFNLIEVGIGAGGSLQTWKTYFPKATIIGVEIKPGARRYESDRVVVKIGSQADTALMTEICQAYPPSIMIDDGSHLAEHHVVTFETVFPYLAPGGFYTIEDMVGQFGKLREKNQTDTFTDSVGYFMSIARNRLACGTEDTPCPVPESILSEIDSITMVGAAFIMRKTDPVRNVAAALSMMEAHAGRGAEVADVKCLMAGYALRHGAPSADALALIDESIAHGGPTPERMLVRARALLANGDPEAAAKLVAEAESVGPDRPAFRNRIKRLRREIAQGSAGPDDLDDMEAA